MLKSGVNQQRHHRLFCGINKYRYRSFIFIILACLFLLHGLLFRQWQPYFGVSVIRDPSLPKTTIVLMGYSTKRLENYQQIFPAYGAMEQALDRIIFLWNSKSFIYILISLSLSLIPNFDHLIYFITVLYCTVLYCMKTWKMILLLYQRICQCRWKFMYKKKIR